MFGIGLNEIIILIGVFLFFHWIIFDAIRRPSNLYKLGKKGVWIVLLIFIGQPTALVYYFTNRRGNLIPKK